MSGGQICRVWTNRALGGRGTAKSRNDIFRSCANIFLISLGEENALRARDAALLGQLVEMCADILLEVGFARMRGTSRVWDGS